MSGARELLQRAGALQLIAQDMQQYPHLEVGSIVRQMPLTPEVQAQVYGALDACVQSMKRAFGNAYAAVLAQYDLMPNGAVTLLPQLNAQGGAYVPGDTFPAGTSINLVPYIAGAVQSQFRFVPEMTLLRLFASQADADAGWRVQGETFKLSDHASSAFKFDVGLHGLQPNSDFQTSPFGWLARRSPQTAQDMRMLAFNGSGEEQPFLGITVTFHDRRCREDGLAPGLDTLSWTDIVDTILEECTGCRPPRANRPPPFWQGPSPFPGLTPAPNSGMVPIGNIFAGTMVPTPR